MAQVPIFFLRGYERGNRTVLCVGGCGQQVERNLGHDHGVCAGCWEIVQAPPQEK